MSVTESRFFVRFLPLIFALALAAGCADQPSEPAARPVLIHEVAGGGALSREFSGSVASPITSRLSFQVGGRIAERLVNPGELVRRGQALFRIDPADIALAEAAANADVAAARSSAQRAASDLARLEGLVEAGSISQSEFDAANAARDATAANLAAARARASEASRQRGYTTLAASRAGTITEVFAQPGQVVSPATPILELAQAGPREAIIAVPEDALASLPKTAIARPLGSKREIAASLKEVSGAADPATRTYRARYRLTGDADDLPIGSTVTIALVLDDTRERIAVPLGALHDPGEGPGVWLIDQDSRARWQKVSLVELREEEAIVEGALAAGARIVGLGAHLVVEGEELRAAQIGAREGAVAAKPDTRQGPSAR